MSALEISMEVANDRVRVDPSVVRPLSSAEAPPETLKGRLGTLDIVFTVLAYNAPITALTGYIALLVSMGNGLGTPVVYIVAGLLMLLFAVGFTTMTKHVTNAGAFYAYITAGLGRPLGLGSAYTAILAYSFMLLGMYMYGGVVYDNLANSIFGWKPLPWWAYSFLLMAVVSVFGFLRVSLSAKVLTFALICELLIVLVWEVVIAATKGPSNLTISWLTPEAITSGSIGVGLLLGVTSFAGFEATAVFREEVRDPEKTVPRATYCSIIVMAVVYASAAYFFITGFGAESAVGRAVADPSTAGLESVGTFLGRLGQQSVSVLVCSSTFAALLALHNIIARYIYCLGIDGTLPRVCASIHPRHGSPYKASVMVTVIGLVIFSTIALYGVHPYAAYGALTGVSGYALLLLLTLTSLAVVVFFARTKHSASMWKSRYAPIVSLASLIIVGWLATTNLELLIGSAKVSNALLSFIFGTLVIGLVYAMRLKSSKPDVYDAIGRQKI